jgi:hypothetical protein
MIIVKHGEQKVKMFTVAGHRLDGSDIVFTRFMSMIISGERIVKFSYPTIAEAEEAYAKMSKELASSKDDQDQTIEI